MAKQSISVTLEPETIYNLKKMASEEYRNVSNMIDYIVAQYVINKNVSNSEKFGRAVMFADRVEITDFNETQEKLKKNVHLDKDEQEFFGDIK